MKTFKQFLNEQLSEEDFSELKKYGYNYIKKWCWQQVTSRLEINVDTFIEDDFPYGLQNMPDPVTLYRILQVNNKEGINKLNLGYHFVGDINKFNEEFFDSIGLEKKTHWKKFIVTVETNLDNINFKNSVITAINYPNEHEYRIKDDSKLEIIDIKEYENL